MTLTIKNILVGLDFSAHSDAALGYAFEVADKFDAHVHLVHVYTLQDRSESEVGSKSQSEAQLSTERSQLDASADAHRASGRVGEVLWLEGDPAETLLCAAQERGADLIVLGASGRTGLKRLLLGSVAETVVREAKASVWIART
jgi:nucleotide-binding universal stress UspA family protein